MSDETKNPQSTQIMLNPQQSEFIDLLAQSIPPARFILSAAAGTGKTLTLINSARAMNAKSQSFRCLVIVDQKVLAKFWQDQLLNNACLPASEITPQTYRRLQAETGGDVNIWSTLPCAVVATEFLNTEGRIDEILEAGWDLVILDGDWDWDLVIQGEIQRSDNFTKRGNAAERIWSSPSVGVAVVASRAPKDPFEWLAEHSGTTRIRWSLPDMMKHMGFPERRVHTINYEPSIPEKKITVLVDELVHQMPKDQAAQFAAIQLKRRLISSMYALEQTLRRLLTVETFGDTDLNDWSSEDLEEEPDDTAIANSVQINRPAAEAILMLLEGETSDSKWECCFNLLNEHGIGKTSSGIIFTDYADTAEYLEYMAKSRDLKVFLLTGALTTDHRRNALQQARTIPSLLIATGAIEGADLAFTDQVIHYDLPRNPNTLLQRMGRIERVTSQFETINHYHIVEQCAANDALTNLMDKLRSVAEEWK